MFFVVVVMMYVSWHLYQPWGGDNYYSLLEITKLLEVSTKGLNDLNYII